MTVNKRYIDQKRKGVVAAVSSCFCWRTSEDESRKKHLSTLELMLGSRMRKSITFCSFTLSGMSNARLHLIIQFPVLENLSLAKKKSVVNMRQEEFSYCLQRNLLSPHVSQL